MSRLSTRVSAPRLGRDTHPTAGHLRQRPPSRAAVRRVPAPAQLAQRVTGLFCAMALLVALFMPPARAAEPAAPAIRDTIQRQLDAFAAGDVAGAFAFASPALQGLFGTPEVFGAMVQTGYPMVWSPGRSRFGPLLTIDGALWQQVMLADQAGGTHVLRYRMEQTDQGWRIAAVVRLPRGEANA